MDKQQATQIRTLCARIYIPILLLCTDVCVVFFNICALFSGARGSFLALSATGHTGDLPVHHGASLGPGRSPWRVLWAFEVVKSNKQSRGRFPRSPRS